MNERIQKLIEQAYERQPVIVADPVTFEPIHKIGNYNEPMYHNVFNPEKFAELIAQDCISQIALIGISNFENNDIMWAVERSIEIIKERFMEIKE